MGALHFDITGDNKNLLKSLEGSKQGIKSVTQTAETESVKLEDIMKRIGQSAAAIGLGFSATQLIKDVARVRGEFQQLEVALTTMLGSEEKANALFQQLVDTAAKTPFDLQGVAGGAKQLLAYGIAAEEVNDTIIRLGDIAAGLSIPLGDLVYLYGTTMTQGRMFTQDLRQFQGRGIPLADELAKQFGVTKDAVGELVTSGKVGFENLEKAIVSMTSEGGKFGGLMEKQSKTITGQISNLEDAWDSMLNDLGKKSQDVISGTLSTATSLVENYEKIGKALGGVVAAYGSYKAVLMTMSAIKNAQLKMEQQALAQILVGKKAEMDADLQSLVTKGLVTKETALGVQATREEVKAKLQTAIATDRMAQAELTHAIASYQNQQIQLALSKQRLKQAQAQLVLAKASGNQQQIENAQLAVNSAIVQVNTERRTSSTMARELQIATTNANTAAQQRETLAGQLENNTLGEMIKQKLALAAANLKVIATNPYFLAATAAAALAFGIYKLVTAKSSEEKAIEKVNKAHEESKKQREEEKGKIDELTGIINSDTQTRTAQVKAYEELTKTIPEYTDGLSFEAFQAMSATEQEKLLNEVLEKREYAKLNKDLEQYESMLAEVEAAEGVWTNMSVETQNAIREMFGTGLLKNKEADLIAFIASTKAKIKEYDDAVENAKPISERLDAAEAELNTASNTFNKLKDEMDSSMDVSEGLVIQFNQAKAIYEAALAKVEELKAKASKDTTVDKNKQNLGEQFQIEQKAYLDAKAAFDKANANRAAYSVAEYETLKTTLDDAKKRFEALGGDTSEKSLKSQIDIDKERVELAEETARELAKIRGSELDQELADIKANYDDRIKEIENLEKEWRKAQGGNLTTEQQDTLTNARSAAQATHDKEANDARLEYQRDIDDAMLDLKRQTQDDWMSLEENEHASKMAAIQRDYEDRIAEIDKLERELREKQGGQLTEEQTQTFADARSGAQAKRNNEEKQANKDTLNSMLSDIMTYNQKRQQVEEEYAKKRKELYQEDGVTLKEGVTEDNVANLDSNRDEALQAVDEEFASKSAEYQGWMDTISEMTLKQLQRELETAKVALSSIESDSSASERDVAMARAKVTHLEKQIEQVEGKDQVKGRSIEKWKELKDVLAETGDEFIALGDEIGGTAGDVLKNVGNVVTSTMGLMNNIVQVVELCSGGIVKTSDGASKAVKAVETASVILAVISVAIQLITKIVNLANKMHDAKYEKIIESNQEKIDGLKDSYKELEEAVSNTFGSKAVQGLKDMNASLEQQNKLIQQQKDAEQEKKKEDESAIEGYDDAMEANRKQMEENKKAMEEAVFGDDIKSAIESFADAYGEAIAEGKDLNESMKDHAVKMMKQMVQEEIKAYIAGQGKLEALREKMALYFEDGIFSDSEIKAIKVEAEAIGRDLDEKFAWAEDLLAEEDSSSSGGSSKRGIATASQESVDENNGRLMSIQLSMGAITEQMVLSVQTMNLIARGVSDGNVVLSDIRLQAVKANGFLEDIVKYTKPLNDSLTNVVDEIKKIQL